MRIFIVVLLLMVGVVFAVGPAALLVELFSELGLKGIFVKREDTVRSFKEICEGKYDDLPEQAFYMVGTIEDAIEKYLNED